MSKMMKKIAMVENLMGKRPSGRATGSFPHSKGSSLTAVGRSRRDQRRDADEQRPHPGRDREHEEDLEELHRSEPPRLRLGVIGGAHQRPRLDVGEAEARPTSASSRNSSGMVVARHRQMLRGRAEVLAESQDAHVGRAQVAHGRHQLVPLLAEPEDDARLGEERRAPPAGPGGRARASARSGRRGGPACTGAAPSRCCGSGCPAPPRSPPGARPRCPGSRGSGARRGSPARAAGSRRTVAAKCAAPPSARSSRFTEVMTTCSRPSSPTARPTRSGSSRSSHCGPPMGNGAVAAVPGAHVAQDHEGRGQVLPALADVRAVGLLAHRVEVPLPHQALQAEVLRPARRPHLEPGRLG